MANDDLDEVDLSEQQIDAMIRQGESVDVTGPPEPAAGVHVELLNPTPSTFGWRVVTPQGEILAISAAQYSGRAAALRALRALTSALQGAPVIDSDGHDDQRMAG